MSGSAVSVLAPGSDGRLRLDEDEVRRIFCRTDTRDLPVSIISVAGAMRTGKSFLLGK